MEFSDIKDVLTFAAFRPEPDNPAAPWANRFPNRRSVLLNVSRGQVDWCLLGKKQNVEGTGSAQGEFTEIAANMADEWESHSEDGWVGVSLNSRVIITLEHNLSRKSGWEETIRNNPKSILGTKFDRTKRYALAHNTETNSSLLMAADQSLIQTVENGLRNHNLRAARICCGLFAMSTHLLQRIDLDPSLKSQDLLILTWCENSLFVMRQKSGHWQEVRCRAGLPPTDEHAITQILKPFRRTMDASTRVIFLADQPGSPFEQQFLPQFENHHITNFTEDHTLWSLLGER